ncbi:MAG: L,D-transpeptidase family protein [Ferruginibacter sp.]
MRAIGKIKTVYFLLTAIVLLMIVAADLKAGVLVAHTRVQRVSLPDTTISVEIARQINDIQNGDGLYYPKSVARFYADNRFESIWVKTGTNLKPTWEAMLIIDCVLQFGLEHSDYHPDELLYPTLHAMLDTPANFSNARKARFDIMLTDALINLMNHLHHGKLNPVFTADKIDADTLANFRAEAALANALHQNDFMASILSVQPKIQEYVKLQNHLRLLTGQYIDDCYEVPDGQVRQIAINMERLRWINSGENAYVHINIPSFTLKFHQPDTVYQFKVIVGKPATQTPVLQSNIAYFTTAPDWKVPAKIFAKEILPKAQKDNSYLERNQFAIYNNKGTYIVPAIAALRQIQQNPGGYYIRQSSGCDNSLGLIMFRFQNPYSVYLHDTPEKKLFARDARALSHGCIRVENAGKLADIMLKYDGSGKSIPIVHNAMNAYKTKTFTLKTAVPIKITYLTCEVNEGELITYTDIYKKDQALEMALYNVTDPLAMK